MKYISPINYLKIDIANSYGLDKKTWDQRIQWVNGVDRDLEVLDASADAPILYRKAVRALRDVQAGIPTGFIMGLDATASGLQIMAVLSGCHKTAANVNLIDTGNREDIYQKIADKMNTLIDDPLSKGDIKKPVMTHFYGSRAQPKRIFGEGTEELAAFYAALASELPGAGDVLSIVQSYWNPEALKYTWTLPDGHMAVVKVMTAVDKKIEVDEFDHSTFTHRAYINQAQDFGLSLCANVIHSIDGYVVREMIRRSHKLGYELVTIHDSFWCSPNHMHKTRTLYLQILAELAQSNILRDILEELSGVSRPLNKDSYDLHEYILQSEYALS